MKSEYDKFDNKQNYLEKNECTYQYHCFMMLKSFVGFGVSFFRLIIDGYQMFFTPDFFSHDKRVKITMTLTKLETI